MFISFLGFFFVTILVADESCPKIKKKTVLVESKKKNTIITIECRKRKTTVIIES